MTSHWTSQSFSEHLCQADLSRLAPRVVTARVLVILSGSFTSQIEMGLTLTWFSNSWGINSPQCWQPDFNTQYATPAMTGCWTGMLTTTLSDLSPLAHTNTIQHNIRPQRMTKLLHLCDRNDNTKSPVVAYLCPRWRTLSPGGSAPCAAAPRPATGRQGHRSGTGPSSPSVDSPGGHPVTQHLSEWTLTHIYLSEWTLTHTYLSQWTLTHLYLSEWTLTHIYLSQWTLTHTYLSQWTLTHLYLSEWTLTHIYLSQWTLTHIYLSEWTLTHIYLCQWTLTHLYLSQWTLTHLYLCQWTLTHFYLYRWTPTHLYLSQWTLKHINLSQLTLTHLYPSQWKLTVTHVNLCQTCQLHSVSLTVTHVNLSRYILPGNCHKSYCQSVTLTVSLSHMSISVSDTNCQSVPPVYISQWH